MLRLTELVALERSLRRTPVLSVYLEGAPSDPALLGAWPLQLEQVLGSVRARLTGASRESREQFATCVTLLQEALATPRARSGAAGWVAFVTPKGTRHAGPLHSRMPLLAVWGRGAFVAPYLRALEESRPVVLALVDARNAEAYRYEGGTLEKVATLQAEHGIPPLAHMGDAPRVGFHSGTRGVAGRDAAQRARQAGMMKMITELAARLTALAGEDAWVLVGGIPRVVAHTMKLLDLPATRLLALDSLDVHSTEAQLCEAARRGAATLRDAESARQLAAVAAQDEARALGVGGPAATVRALRLACVRTLYVSERFVVEHPSDAARCVRVAFDQDAGVVEVARESAQRLDALGGIAASLRFRPPELDTAPRPRARKRLAKTRR